MIIPLLSIILVIIQLFISESIGQAVNGLMYFEGTKCEGSVIRVNADKLGRRPVPSEKGKCESIKRFSSYSGAFTVSLLKGTYVVNEGGDLAIKYFYKVNVCVPDGLVNGALIAKCDGNKATLESYDDFDCKVKSAIQKPMEQGYICKTFDGKGGESAKTGSSGFIMTISLCSIIFVSSMVLLIQ